MRISSRQPHNPSSATVVPAIAAATPQPTARTALALTALFVIGGFVLRFNAALGDFWLDEIWSYTIAMSGHSLIDVLYYRVDNNHLLNTMIMHLLGDQPYWLIYRIPAVIAGTATIVLAGLAARRWGTAPVLGAMLLIAASYPMIHYSSEARGYALAMCFALVALLFMRRHLERADIFAALACGCICVLGVMSHPLFLQVHAALIGWAIFDQWKRQYDWRKIVFTQVALNVAPLITYPLLYMLHFGGMRIGGGQIVPVHVVLSEATALLAGAPNELPWPALVGLVAAALLIAGLVWLRRRDDSAWMFLVLIIAVVPAAMLLLARPNVLYARYFLLPMMFLLLLGGAMLGEMLMRPGVRRIVAAIALAAFLGGNTISTARLLQEGRGHYLAALAFMAAATPGDEIRVTADHEFRHRIVIEFYERYLGSSKRIRYIESAERDQEQIDWFIAHSFDNHLQPPHELVHDSGDRYRLAASYDYAGLSGWRWFVYRKATRAAVQ